MEKNEHTYYWAWAEQDNPGHSYFAPHPAQWYRVFRDSKRDGARAVPVTEPMSKEEAIAYCKRIVKLTGGREIE